MTKGVGIFGVSALIAVAGPLSPIRLHAEPYLAFRTGYKCSVCHVNKTGGGKRTGFGFVYSQTFLAGLKPKPDGESSLFMNRNLNDNISVGANFRVGSSTTLGTDETREQDESKRDNSVTMPEASFYMEVEAIPNYVSFYLDEKFGPSGSSVREAMVLVQGLPWDAYLKFGRFMLPYGIRLLDDNAFIRTRSGFNYQNQDFGYEIGLEPGPFSLSVSMTNGNKSAVDNDRFKQITMVGYIAKRNWRLGGSFSTNRNEETSQTIAGWFAGVNFGKVTLMAERDVISESLVDENSTTDSGPDFGDEVVSFWSANILLTRGVNLKWAYNFHDPRSQWDQDEKDRHIFGLEMFPIPFLQTSIFYEYRTSVPQEPTENEDRVIFELHFFF